MITQTSDSHQIPSQNKTKLQIVKSCQKKLSCEILHETLHVTHLLKLLDKMYEYEIDPTRTVGATERKTNAGRRDGQATDGRTDGRTDGQSETYSPPNNFGVRGGYNIFS